MRTSRIVVSVDLDHREWLGDRSRGDRAREGWHHAPRQAGRSRGIAIRRRASIAYAASERRDLPRVIGRDFDFRRAPGGWSGATPTAMRACCPCRHSAATSSSATRPPAPRSSTACANELPVQRRRRWPKGFRNAYLSRPLRACDARRCRVGLRRRAQSGRGRDLRRTARALAARAAHARSVRRDARQGSRAA